MIYLITLNKLKNTYCTKAYLHTKFASAKKKNKTKPKNLIWWRCTLLDKSFSCRFPRPCIDILFIRMLPVVMPLQGTRYIAGIVAMCTAEGLGAKRKMLDYISSPLQDTGLSCNVLIPRNHVHFWKETLSRKPLKTQNKLKLQLNST